MPRYAWDLFPAMVFFGAPPQRAHLGTATADFSLSPPAERGEGVGERGTNMMADECRKVFPA